MSAGTPRSGVIAGLALVALALVVSEGGMLADGGKRPVLYGVFAGATVLSGLLGWWLVRVHRRLPTLQWTVLAVAVAAIVVASGVVAASTSAMFLTGSELRLVLAALLLGAGLGVLVATSVTAPLTRDLRHLADVAHRVADGDLDGRTEIERSDEVGALARSLDQMIAQLARADEERDRDAAARQRLLTAIGHDLRTPLASLQAAVEAMQDGVAPDPAQYLRSMATDVELLRDMVEDLFVLVRLETGELALERLRVDLTEVADGVVEAITPLANRKDVRLRLESNGPVLVDGDPQALNRVLRNLLDNAVRHTPGASTVDVSIDTADGFGVVRVQDAGPGFPPAFVDQAFDVFSRADAARSRHGGTGLGLAIARQFVHAHGGTAWIDPGPPTTVAFRIPTS